MNQELIHNHETLYRRVRNLENEHFGYRDGKFRFFSSAFNSPDYKPSVDRASLRSSPLESKTRPDDGIILLKASAIRSINCVEAGTVRHAIDVHYRPIVEDPINMAHSQVEPAPEISNRKIFRKLQDALARLASDAGWLIEPRNSDD